LKIISDKQHRLFFKEEIIMAFCGKCGTEYEEGAKFCPSCGASTEIIEEPAPVIEEQPVEQAQPENFADKFAAMNETPDITDSYTAEDIGANKVMGILAYCGPLVLVPILAAKESPFAKFHSNQGLVLMILHIIIIIACTVLAVIPIIGWIIGLILPLVSFVLSVLGIINVINGRAKELPIVGKFRILK